MSQILSDKDFPVGKRRLKCQLHINNTVRDQCYEENVTDLYRVSAEQGPENISCGKLELTLLFCGPYGIWYNNTTFQT